MVLSVLLAAVSARCVRVRERSDLGLDHEDAGCSRGAERAVATSLATSLARCAAGGGASSAAAAVRGAVRFRRGTFHGRKCRCRGTARARGGRLLAQRGHYRAPVSPAPTQGLHPHPHPRPYPHPKPYPDQVCCTAHRARGGSSCYSSSRPQS